MNTDLRVGVICDLDYTRSRTFSSYYYAITSLFQSVKIINSNSDLNDVDLVFVGNDHYTKHRQLVQDDSFITACNALNIKFCVYTAENTLKPIYPHNVEGQQKLSRYKRLYQRVLDVDDSIALNKKIARCLISKHYKDPVPVPTNKLNKCVFIGFMYDHRRDLINQLKSTIDIDIIDSGIDSWFDYMSVLAKYRFVLSPYSYCSNSFHLKFYEALLVGSIPVHQVFDNTLQYYPIEAAYKDAIYFKTADKLPDKLAQCTLQHSYNKPWLEDELKDFFIDCGVSFNEK